MIPTTLYVNLKNSNKKLIHSSGFCRTTLGFSPPARLLSSWDLLLFHQVTSLLLLPQVQRCLPRLSALLVAQSSGLGSVVHSQRKVTWPLWIGGLPSIPPHAWPLSITSFSPFSKSFPMRIDFFKLIYSLTVIHSSCIQPSTLPYLTATVTVTSSYLTVKSLFGCWFCPSTLSIMKTPCGSCELMSAVTMSHTHDRISWFSLTFPWCFLSLGKGDVGGRKWMNFNRLTNLYHLHFSWD